MSQDIATMREMLATLETLTVAGRRHNMRKIVSFIERLLGGARPHLVAAALLERLARESSRPHPDVRRFSETGERLLGLLS